MGGNLEAKMANKIMEEVNGRIIALKETNSHKNALNIMNDEVCKIKRERRDRYFKRRFSASNKTRKAAGIETLYENTDFVRKNSHYFAALAE